MLQLGLAPVAMSQLKLRDRHQFEKPSRQKPRHLGLDVGHGSTEPIGAPFSSRRDARNQAACNIDDKPSIILIRALSIIVTTLTAATVRAAWR